MSQRSFIDRELRRLKSMPKSVWLLLGATSIGFVVNVLIALSLAGLKIDQGTATLFGAAIGFGVIAWQARLGFANLIASQENQARIEREARLHTAEIERMKADEHRLYEKQLLLSGLRAEMVSLHKSAGNVANSSRDFALLYRALHEGGVKPSIKELTIVGFSAPFYQQHIGRLGVLGVSLAADVIKAFSRVRDVIKIVWQDPAPNSVVAIAYATSSIDAYHLQSDLFQVAMRIRSVEEGTPDPGTLADTEARRYGELPKIEALIPKNFV